MWVVLVDGDKCARARVVVAVASMVVVVVVSRMVMIAIGLAAVLGAQGLLQGRGAGGHGMDDAVSIDSQLLRRTRGVSSSVVGVGSVSVGREC